MCRLGAHGRVNRLDAIVRDWFAEPRITLACGDWGAGAIMEFVPDDAPVLTRERYAEPFVGLRDVRLPGQGHHIHLDLAKMRHVVYAIVPSVCYGYRPSFEAHFVSAVDATPSFAVMVRDPYRAGRLNREALVGYFRRMVDHLTRFPELVRFRVEAPPVAPSQETWAEIRACLAEACGDDDAPGSLLRSFEDMPTAEAAHA